MGHFTNLRIMARLFGKKELEHARTERQGTLGMTKGKAKFFDRLSYRFDNMMSRGLVAVISLLTLATLIFVGLISAVVAIFHLLPPAKEMDFLEIYWAAILRTLDAGTMGNDEGFGFRLAMFIVTIGGVIVVASLIGAISNAFSARVERLRKGRSRVIESGHTLILGWNSKIFSIIRELEIANQSLPKPAIVILAPQDKVWMEDKIHTNLRSDGNSRIVVRSGDPLSIHDVGIGSPASAKGIIILAPDEIEDPDAMSIKTCLALLNKHRDNSQRYSIVAELRDDTNLDAARLVGGNEVHWVHGRELICRLIVQTCRQSGLSSVFTELLDFEGSELYIAESLSVSGKKYGEAAESLAMGCAIGFIEGDEIVLNPPASTKLGPESQLIVIAEDDTQIAFTDKVEVEHHLINNENSREHGPEKTLVLGTNKNTARILQEMSGFMPAGSSVTLVSEFLRDFPDVAIDGLPVECIQSDPTSRSTLGSLPLSEYRHIVVLAESEQFSVQHCDSRTLLTLLHIRELAKALEIYPNIVSEMLDDKNRQLAETTNADDFIVSDKLVSLMLAQISENPNLSRVFSQLLSSEGSEIRLHPAEWYVQLGERVNFTTIVHSALRIGDTAIGYQILGNRDADQRLHGLTLNPLRADKITFSQGDKIAVLTNV